NAKAAFARAPSTAGDRVLFLRDETSTGTDRLPAFAALHRQLELRHLPADGLGDARADADDPDRLVPKAQPHGANREGALHVRADRVEDGLVVALHGGDQDVIAEVRLVGVDADAPHTPDRGRGERAQAAPARGGEDDVGPDVDLAVGERLAR